MGVSDFGIPVVFECGADQLVGIATSADKPSDLGVLILVGGRQYRAGSHRQFVLLARRLARSGYCTFRFDFRGMGDSSGQRRSFEEVYDDIAAAIACFQATCPAVQRIVLWGLCDAATAAVLYWWRLRDERITGMCLVNPWLRSDAGLARTRVRHYYRQRLLDAEFWGKLLRGKIGPLRSLSEYFTHVKAARTTEAKGFQQSMLEGLAAFTGPLLLLLSERDLTAREFHDGVNGDAVGRKLLKQDNVLRVDIADSDHTFSSELWRRQAEEAVVSWMAKQA